MWACFILFEQIGHSMMLLIWVELLVGVDTNCEYPDALLV